MEMVRGQHKTTISVSVGGVKVLCSNLRVHRMCVIFRTSAMFLYPARANEAASMVHKSIRYDVNEAQTAQAWLNR